MSAPVAPPRKLLDAAVVASAGEALCRLLSPADSLKERAWPKAAANNHPSNPIFDVEKSIDEGNIGRLFKQNSCFDWRSSKHSTPSITQTRRDEGATPKVSETLTPVPDRRTGCNAVRFPKVSLRDTAQVPVPANDNWSPLEAA